MFYNDLNLESFDASASTTLVDALGLVPSPPLPPLSTVPLNAACPRPAATATDVKGKGRMIAIISTLTDDSPQPDRSFGIGPPPAYTSPVPPPRTTSYSAASGRAAGKGAQSGAGARWGGQTEHASTPEPYGWRQGECEGCVHLWRAYGDWVPALAGRRRWTGLCLVHWKLVLTGLF